MFRRCLAFLSCLFLLPAGCQDSDRERLRKAGGRSAEHLQALAGGPDGKLGSSLDALRGALGEKSIDGRVATRLRWDKELVGSAFQVRLSKPGVVLLEGTVPSPEARQRALQVAHATTGVEEVVEQLKVAPPPPPAPPK